MHETIFRRKQGIVQAVAPDRVLPKAREDRRDVSLLFPRVLPDKARKPRLTSEDFPIRNGGASLACQEQVRKSCSPTFGLVGLLPLLQRCAHLKRLNPRIAWPA